MSDSSISIVDGGKRFNREWIFRKLNYTFEYNTAYAITGSNGTGKSTLLQCISGAHSLSEGTISWGKYNHENIFTQLSICAPYLGLIEEMTGEEFLQFHSKFKPLRSGFSIEEILETVDIAQAANKQIRYYSSGMKQRMKLAQAFFSDTQLLLLDEPCSNLDKTGYTIYNQLLEKFSKNTITIVCSNEEAEISFCTQRDRKSVV